MAEQADQPSWYLVSVGYDDRVSLVALDVVKETAKQIKVLATKATGFRTTLLKQHDRIFNSLPAAIECAGGLILERIEELRVEMECHKKDYISVTSTREGTKPPARG